MTPRDAWRCAGWAARMAAWAKLRQWGATPEAASARTGVQPVTGAWRRNARGDVLTFDDGPALRMVAVREWLVTGPTTWAVGDGVVWVLTTESEGR